MRQLLKLEPRTWDFIDRLEPKLGLVEHMTERRESVDLITLLDNCRIVQDGRALEEQKYRSHSMNLSELPSKKPRIAVVGSGPSGLFTALVLGELGAEVTLIERGEAVEQRGRDIGALVVRRILQSESNFCFGEVCFFPKCYIDVLSLSLKIMQFLLTFMKFDLFPI